MSIEKDLRNYRPMCKEIEHIQEKLKKAKRHVFDSVQTAAEFPYWKHTVIVEGDIYPKDVTPERERLCNLIAKKRAVERFVENIDDYRVQRMIQLHYLEDCDCERIGWEDVAEAMNDGSTGDSCRMKVHRFLEKR